MQQDHDKIRQRAYEIWDRNGRQEGQAEDHWLQAEREIAGSVGTGSDALQSEAAVPAQAKRKGNGVEKSAVPNGATIKPAQAGPRKRRGAQPSPQA